MRFTSRHSVNRRRKSPTRVLPSGRVALRLHSPLSDLAAVSASVLTRWMPLRPCLFPAVLITAFAILLASRLPALRTLSTRPLSTMPQLKNVVVVGGSYVGLATANELISTLPSTDYRVVVVEKNSHFGHLFAYPRYAPEARALFSPLTLPAPRFALTTPGLYEHKAFIPYTTTLALPHTIVRAAAVTIHERSVTLDRPISLDGTDVTELNFEALVMATGTRLRPPGTLPGETKAEGVEWFKAHQERVAKAKRIVIVGGGAVGVRKLILHVRAPART